MVRPTELTPKLRALKWLVESQPFALFSVFIKRALVLWLADVKSQIKLANSQNYALPSPNPYAELKKHTDELKTLLDTAPTQPIQGLSNPSVISAVLTTVDTILTADDVATRLKNKPSQWMKTIIQRGWGFWPETEEVNTENITTEASANADHSAPVELASTSKAARADDVTIESSYAAFKRAVHAKSKTKSTTDAFDTRGRTKPKRRYRPETDPWLVEYGGETRSIAW